MAAEVARRGRICPQRPFRIGLRRSSPARAELLATGKAGSYAASYRTRSRGLSATPRIAAHRLEESRTVHCGGRAGMWHVLVDHARERAAQKRGGGAMKLPISRAERVVAESEVDLVELNDALERLAKESPRKAKVVELYYFGGLSAKEIAEVLSADGTSISQRTVENDLKIARAKLHGWLRNK